MSINAPEPDTGPDDWISTLSTGGGAGEVRMLSRHDVRRCLVGVDVVGVVRETLVLHDRGRCVLPDEGYLPWRNSEGAYSRSIAMPGAVLPTDGAPSYGLKIINASVSNPSHGLERAGGVGICMDPETARITTIMEVGLLSALRTAAVTAVGVEATGFADTDSVAIVGCGMQGRTHLFLLLNCLPGVRRVALYDWSAERTGLLAADVAARAPHVSVTVGREVADTVRGARLVITATTSDEGYVPAGWLDPHALVAHVSLADLTDDAILGASALYVDDVELIVGNPRRPLGRLMSEGRVVGPDAPQAAPGVKRIDATLGGLLDGRHRPVGAPQAHSVLNAFGMGVLDVALLDAVRGRAETLGVGVSVPMG